MAVPSLGTSLSPEEMVLEIGDAFEYRTPLSPTQAWWLGSGQNATHGRTNQIKCEHRGRAAQPAMTKGFLS